MTRLEARLRSTERARFARCGVEPTEHIVRAGSAADAPRLRVLTCGTGAPVVCLHAASWFAAHWAPLCARLPARRKIGRTKRSYAAGGGITGSNCRVIRGLGKSRLGQ